MVATSEDRCLNYGDPFGLCPAKTLAEVPQCVGQTLAPLSRAADAAAGAALEMNPISQAFNAGWDIGSGRAGQGLLGIAFVALPEAGGAGRLFLARGAGSVASKEAGQLAEYLGFGRRAKGVPFNSHGQAVFTNGKNFITIDVDSHSGGVWKMFDRIGERMGTYDALLTKIKP